MIIKKDTPIGNKTLIKRSDGIELSGVKQFNTKTKMAIVYGLLIHKDKSVKVAITKNPSKEIGIGRAGKAVQFKCFLEDYKAFDKETGLEIV